MLRGDNSARAQIARSRVKTLRALQRTIDSLAGEIRDKISRCGTEGRTYYERCLARGKTKREAIRDLKRRISDRVWTLLNAPNLT